MFSKAPRRRGALTPRRSALPVFGASPRAVKLPAHDREVRGGLVREGGERSGETDFAPAPAARRFCGIGFMFCAAAGGFLSRNFRA